MYRVLKSTTSLTMCVALALPVGGFAQTTPQACAADAATAQFPCVLPDGTEVGSPDQLQQLQDNAAAAAANPASGIAAAEAEAAAAAEQAQAEEAAQAAAAEAQAAADAQAAEQAQAAAAAEEQAAVEAQIRADAEAQAAADEAAAANAQAETPPADATADIASETAPAATAETAPAPTTDAPAAAEAETAPEVTPEAAPEATAETAPATSETPPAAAETAPEATAETAPEATAETAPEATAETAPEATAETAPEATTETEIAPVTTETQQTAPEATAETAAEPARTEEEIAAELLAQQEAEQARAEQRAEEAAAAAAAAAAADNGTAEAEVTTEEVTADETRASDQEFSTSVTGEAAGTAQTNDDDGMSNFEKAVLLGLGAVAVGAVLKNGSKVMSNSGDRLVVQDPNGDLRVLKDDSALVRQAGDEVRRETFNDGSSRTTVTKPDGSQVVTILGRDGTVLRRINVDAQGNQYVLFDDTQAEQQIVVNELPQVQQNSFVASQQNEDALRRALESQARGEQARTFSLRQVRDIQQVRALAPEVELDAVRFATGSAAIQPEQARSLATIGTAISQAIQDNPRTVILVEGHTDAVGDAGYNLALSDRRAETVALALTEYFNVPAANLVTQGYGESTLKVPTQTAEPANRRAVVRNITGLLQ
jgi:outer membrane protein OmpA-like peptidoglycan-associated protein